jgi:ribonuclease PH
MIRRIDGRQADQMREVTITEDYVKSADASFFLEVGRTRVLCCASIDEEIPRWLKGKGKGWVTAEYNMLPKSSPQRVRRERNGASGRTQEIQRLIGRALRGVCDMQALGERQILIDCDVLEADGGTRTASIVGGFLALARVLQKLKASHPPATFPKPILKHFVSAVSVGLVEDATLLDLCYVEDADAAVDMNVVMTDSGDFVELQGTGEESVFSRKQLNDLLDMGEKGCRFYHDLQRKLLGEKLP